MNFLSLKIFYLPIFLCLFKIIIEEGRAVGVEFVHNGTTYRRRAKEEIILAAGAIGSPQILMLSGIGPKKHLENLGVSILFPVFFWGVGGGVSL